MSLYHFEGRTYTKNKRGGGYLDQEETKEVVSLEYYIAYNFSDV
jgi:hypothetical protein